MSRNRIRNSQQSIAWSTGDQHSPSANTDAVVTYAASASNVSHVITGFSASVVASQQLTTCPTIKIEDGSGNIVFQQALRPQPMGVQNVATVYSLDVQFASPKRGTAGRALIITVPAAGSGTTAKVSVLDHWLETN